MHWLQSTIAARFNRFRQERGHLFQGRYQSVLIEDFATLGRVIDYVHRNPVRAKIVSPEQVGNYRWSSLRLFVKGPRPRSLVASEWLHARGGWSDNDQGWRDYVAHLVALGRDEVEQQRQGLTQLSRGWALGTHAWRRAMAKDHAALRLTQGLARDHARELNEAAWDKALDDLLEASGREREHLKGRPLKQPWNVTLAQQLRREAGASIVWLSRALHLGRPSSVRSYLVRINQQTAA